MINGIQHKNVVKLLGCSINEGPECLLVYEFVPNKSLDQILFGEWSSLNVYHKHSTHTHTHMVHENMHFLFFIEKEIIFAN